MPLPLSRRRGGPPVERIEGASAQALAIAVSQQMFADGGAGGAVVASSRIFAGTLAATPLAASLDGPLLLTSDDRLDPEVEAELQRVLPETATVAVLQGPVQPPVGDRVEELGFTVDRVTAPDRTGQAVEVARRLGEPDPLLLVRFDVLDDAAVAGAVVGVEESSTVLADPTHGGSSTSADYIRSREDALTIALGPEGGAAGDPDFETPIDQRIAGSSPSRTSVDVAERFFDRPATVVLAPYGSLRIRPSDELDRGSYPEQATASRLAASLGAPLLLTPPGVLDAEVEAYLRTGVERVVLVGDEGALSPRVERQAEAAVTGAESPFAGIGVQGDDDPLRLSGAGRLETSIAISRATFGDGTAETVVLARADKFPDALAGAPLAIARFGPLLLTPSNEMPDQVLDEIARVLPADATEVVLLGGEAAIEPQVAEALVAAGFVPDRVSGANRFATAVAIADELPPPTQVLLASGNVFPDALGAGPAAASVGGAVLLTADDQLPEETAAYLQRTSAPRVAVGGPASRAVPDAQQSYVGQGRFETNALLATAYFQRPTVAGIATGDDFPDALTGSAAMGAFGGPILLSTRDGVPDEIGGYTRMRSFPIGDALLFGGASVLEEPVRTQVQELISLQEG